MDCTPPRAAAYRDAATVIRLDFRLFIGHIIAAP